jgi:hypothetical protein
MMDRHYHWAIAGSLLELGLSGLAGVLRGAELRPAPSALGQKELPARRALERPSQGHDARGVLRQIP